MKRRHDQATLGRIKRKTVSVANEEANKIPHTCTQVDAVWDGRASETHTRPFNNRMHLFSKM